MNSTAGSKRSTWPRRKCARAPRRLVDATCRQVLTGCRLIFAASLASAVLLAPHPVEGQLPTTDTPTTTARLVIDFGDGSEKHFTRLDVRADTTVLDLLKQAAEHPRGIRFKHRGKGATAMVTEIDGLANQGNGKNWIFRVNDQLGDRSSGIQTVKPEDTVLWRFENYR